MTPGQPTEHKESLTRLQVKTKHLWNCAVMRSLYKAIQISAKSLYWWEMLIILLHPCTLVCCYDIEGIEGESRNPAGCSHPSTLEQNFSSCTPSKWFVCRCKATGVTLWSHAMLQGTKPGFCDGFYLYNWMCWLTRPSLTSSAFSLAFSYSICIP